MLNWKFVFAVLTVLCIQRFEIGCSSAGVCTDALSRTRTASRQESYKSIYYTSYKYYTRCGFLWLFRCRRTGSRQRSRTLYRTAYYTQRYNEEYCCSGYSGNPPSCRRICPTLSSPTNGRVSVTSYYVGGRATYSCHSGYDLSGSSSQTCSSTGRWSNSKPTCQRVCPSLNSPRNGRISVTTYRIGGRATHTCNNGYALHGSSSILTCSSRGYWDRQQPTCERVCAHPTHPNYGRVTVGSLFVGGQATYSCNSGYRLSGSSTRTCQSNGAWSGMLPTCIRVCPLLNSLRNGHVSVTTYDVGGKATFYCNNGYGVHGSSVRTCSLYGSWDGRQPTCERVCSNPIQPTSGQVSVSSLFVGGQATYSCNSGYRLSGSSTIRTCQSNGAWSGTQPTCIRVCPLLNSPTNGHMSVTTYDVGGRATYTCSDGYGMHSSSVRTCSLHGIWDGQQPTCERVCSHPTHPTYGQVSVSFIFVGGQATYSCNSGYRLSGSSTRTCQSTRVWSGTQPTCSRVCNKLNNPRGGQVTVEEYVTGGTAIYTCDSGYGMVGEPTRTCNSTGWSGTEPHCQIMCPYPDQPINGNVSVKSLLIGERASFECNHGYRLKGSTYRVCQASRSWSGEASSCIRVCPQLMSPINGSVYVNTYDSGGTATYSCDPGYGLSALSTHYCFSNGTWSGEPPTCNVTCPSLNFPNNGQIMINTYLHGGVATYICDRGYQIYGNFHQRICNQGRWTGSEIECEGVTCPSLSAPNNGEVSVTSYIPGGSATYACEGAGSLQGQSVRYCLGRDGTWSGSEPTCIAIANENAASPVRDCPAFHYELIMEGQEEVAQSILEDIILDSDIALNESSAKIALFNYLTDQFDIERSMTNFNLFFEAITEISAAVQEACNGDIQLTDADISQISIQFASTFSLNSKNKDLSDIRMLVGEMLCIKKQAEKRHKRQSKEDCRCPLEGMTEVNSSCEFFRCLDLEQQQSVFGFGSGLYKNELPCLAFVVDTTGSMREEIDDAKNVILQFMRAEENFGGDGCYMLVPFNDVGPEHSTAANGSIGPAAFAFAKDIDELLIFYDNVTKLKAINNSGGDVPEFVLDAILYALEFSLPDGPLLWPGSQIIALTDAPTKNENLQSSVIKAAHTNSICIHFFLSHPDSRKGGVYEHIADETSGTVAYAYSSLEFARFVSSYKENSCNNLINTGAERMKRTSETDSKCRTFRVSQLASSLNFAGEADTISTITLTDPTGISTNIVPQGHLALRRIRHPKAGDWRACVKNGTLKVSVNQDIEIDATVLYRNGQTNGSAIIPPTECSKGEVALLTTKAPLCKSIELYLLDQRKGVVQTVPMTECGQAFLANMTFPRGIYSYQIHGSDYMGIPFSSDIKPVTFREGQYDTKLYKIASTTMRVREKVNETISINNTNHYSSTFNLSAHIPGVSLQLSPSNVTVPPQESTDVILTLSILGSSLSADTSLILTIEADNGCKQMSVSKPVTVTIQQSSNECGCLNGGSCQSFVRRGRVYNRCRCSPGYRGVRCQVQY